MDLAHNDAESVPKRGFLGRGERLPNIPPEVTRNGGLKEIVTINQLMGKIGSDDGGK
jgi:hypothetical protein